MLKLKGGFGSLHWIAAVAFRLLVVSSVAVGLLGGCGNDPSAKCDQFVDVYCERWEKCDSRVTNSICMSAFAIGVNCDTAVAVSDSYDRCIDEVKVQDCAVFISGPDPRLPASCIGIFAFQ